MTTSAPSTVALQPLGKLVQIGGFSMFVRRLTAADLFRVTLELEHGENATADFFVRDGRVLLMGVDAALLMPFGGAAEGRERLTAALQAALKVPAPAPAPVSPELAEFEAARAAWKSCRTLANARRFNAAWCAYHRSIAR